MEPFIEVDDKRYYYRDGETYTEAGDLVPEGEAALLHFRVTGRTPLAAPYLTQEISKDQFRRFHLFLDKLSVEERIREARIAIDEIGARIKRLSDDGHRWRLVQEYREAIEALEQRLVTSEAKSWDTLRQSLIDGKYIEEVSLSDFNSIMNDHHRPGKPVIWNGKKTEALYFCNHFEFKLPEFNKCFSSKDGKPFHKKNATITEPSTEFLAILNNS